MNNSDEFSSMPGGPTKRGRATQHPERRRIWPWLLAGAAVVALGAGLWMTGGAGATGGEAAQNASQVSSAPNGAPVSAEQMAIDLQALADLKKAVGRRVAALDGTWTDGEFAKRRKVIADAQRELAACTEASSLARARELRGDIYDATDWIEHNTAARAGLADAEGELDALARDCAAADAARLAAIALRKAERARKDAAAQRDGGRYEEAAEGYGTAMSLYGAALDEARAAKAAAEVESARSYKSAKLWRDCLAAADKALEWEPGNSDALALKVEAQGAIDAERRAKETAERKAREAEEAARREREAKAAAEKEERERQERERQEMVRREREADEPTRMLDAGAPMAIPVGGQTLRLHWCPPDSFEMGSSSGEEGRYNDEMQHRVTLTRGFWMSETEVTQGLWKEIMGENPSALKVGDNYPVENISWDMCRKFIEKLNAHADVKAAGLRFGLPTEAQWEYACRAGTSGDNGGTGRLNDMGWYVENSGSKTHPVGQKHANAWGLHDMHGNVWEWCADWYGDYYYSKSSAFDPPGPASGGYRVLRGGCYWNSPLLCRSASRFRDTPFSGGRSYGLRLMALPDGK